MRAPGVRWARLARRLRALRALALERVMVVETDLAWGFFLGRPLRLPGVGVRGPPCLFAAGMSVGSGRVMAVEG